MFDLCICKGNRHFSKYLNGKPIRLTVVEAVIYICIAPAKYKETYSNFSGFLKMVFMKTVLTNLTVLKKVRLSLNETKTSYISNSYVLLKKL